MTAVNNTEGGAGDSLTRVTGNFTAQAMAALEKVAAVLVTAEKLLFPWKDATTE